MTAATLLVALPVVVHQHADHADEAHHLEHHHGGHGGILEQDEARIPSPHAPAALPVVAVELPGPPQALRSRPAPDEFVRPLSRAPPASLPRAPPSTS